MGPLPTGTMVWSNLPPADSRISILRDTETFRHAHCLPSGEKDFGRLCPGNLSHDSINLPLGISQARCTLWREYRVFASAANNTSCGLAASLTTKSSIVISSLPSATVQTLSF